jgi:hypothetical protein
MEQRCRGPTQTCTILVIVGKENSQVFPVPYNQKKKKMSRCWLLGMRENENSLKTKKKRGIIQAENQHHPPAGPDCGKL